MSRKLKTKKLFYISYTNFLTEHANFSTRPFSTSIPLKSNSYERMIGEALVMKLGLIRDSILSYASIKLSMLWQYHQENLQQGQLMTPKCHLLASRRRLRPRLLLRSCGGDDPRRAGLGFRSRVLNLWLVHLVFNLMSVSKLCCMWNEANYRTITNWQFQFFYQILNIKTSATPFNKRSFRAGVII